MENDLRRWMRLVEGEVRWGYHGTLLETVPSIAQTGLQSQHRTKHTWDDSSRRMFHLLYFSLQGPHGWGVQRDHKAKPHELAELRFPLTSLKRIRWQEDDERPERDEFYAEGESFQSRRIKSKSCEKANGCRYASTIETTIGMITEVEPPRFTPIRELW